MGAFEYLGWCHELCYAVSKYPDREFCTGGPIISNGDIGLKEWDLNRAAILKDEHPVLTQTGEDRESDEDQYIANMKQGSTAGFKYFNLKNTKEIAIEVYVAFTGAFVGMMNVDCL